MATNNALLAQLRPGEVEIPFGGQVSISPQRSQGSDRAIPALIFQGQDPGKQQVQSALWAFCLPLGTGGYTATTGLKAVIKTNAAKVGNVVWSGRFMLVSATDLQNPSVDTFPALGSTNDVQVTTTYTAGGEVEVSISVPIAKIQNGATTPPAAGDFVRFCLTRVTSNVADTLSDYAKVYGGYIQDY